MKRLAGTLLTSVLVAGFGAYLWAQDSSSAPQTPRTPSTASYSYGCGGGDGWSRMGMRGRGMMGGGMMGRGMMGGGMMYGGMMGRGHMGWASPGRGMMHGGMWMNPNLLGERAYDVCPGHASEFSRWAERNNVSVPLTKESASKWAEYYLSTYNNPDLKLGKIRDKGDSFEVEIRSKKENKVLERVLIDKQTGWVSPVQP